MGYPRADMKSTTIPVLACLLVGLPAQEQAAAAAPPAPSTIATQQLVIRGRLVDAETGAPLARCRVRLSGHQSTGYELSWRAGDWADPAEQTTGADGRFRFAFRLPAAFERIDRARYHLNASHPRHLHWFSHCSFHLAARRGGIDYGDIALTKGLRPRIRCVDTEGNLQAGVLLYLKPAEADPAARHTLPGGPQSWMTRYAYGQTDIDGYLHLDDPVPAGSFRVEVRGRKAARLPGLIRLPTRKAIEVVVARLPAGRCIEGRLLDTRGAPVAGAHLSADQHGASCLTRRDGRFTLVAGERDQTPSVLIHLARNRRYDDYVGLATADWGQRAVELRVPEIQRTAILVTDAAGKPVRDFNLYCLPADRRQTRAGVRLAGSFAEGRARCRLADGVYRLRIFPRSEHLLPSDWQDLEIKAGEPELRVTLRPTHPFRVALRLAYAGPEAAGSAQGARVEVLTGAPEKDSGFVLPATVGTDLERQPPGPRLLAAAICDAQGQAVLRLAAGGRVWLRISGPQVATSLREVQLDAATPLELKVQPGVRVQGQLSPKDISIRLDPRYDPRRKGSIYSYARHTQPTLSFVHESGVRREGVHIAEDGSFCCEGLPPGKVEVRLQRFLRRSKTSFRRDPKPPLLGTLQLRSGAAEPVALEVPAALLAEKPPGDSGR